MQIITIAILAGLVLINAVFSYWDNRRQKINLGKREREANRKTYELAILKELGERIGYSLNVQNIIDIITGSLRQFIEYGAVSYMLLEPEKIIFKSNIEKSVSPNFIKDVKNRMLKSLSALLDQNLEKVPVEELISGAILSEEIKDRVNSFFNIPLVIAGELVGVLTVADTKDGLYKEEEMTILYKITAQASQAVTKLQEVIEIEQRKTNAMVESMIEGVIMTDRDYRIIIANPAAKKAVGLNGNSTPTIFDFIAKLEGKIDIRAKLEESIKLNKTSIVREILLDNSFFQIIISPVKSGAIAGLMADEVLGGVIIFRDITKEKEIEKIKEDFTSMIAHELRSPIDAIKKMAEVMNMTDFNKKKRMEYLRMIYDNSFNLLGLVNNILDEAKLEAGKFEIAQKPSKIKEIIIDRINFFKSSAKDSGLKMNFYIDKNLPEEIICDSYRISQVLNNFISNAIKFTQKGGDVTLQAFLHKKGGNFQDEVSKTGENWFSYESAKVLNHLPESLVVAVVDTGIGLPKENINQLFSKFKSFDSQYAKRGTGLGLVIAKGIIDAHNGIIGVESKEGQGSIFYFTIPLT